MLIDVLVDLKQKYQDKKINIEKKFELLNVIIQLEYDEPSYKTELYQDIKNWLSLYAIIIEKKSFGYDEIIFEKITTRLKYLSTEEQIRILYYFIRILKKNFFEKEVCFYEEYKQKLELKYLIERCKLVQYVIKLSIQNITNLSITLIVSIFIFSGIWYIFQESSLKLFSIPLEEYSKNEFFNYILNICNFIFDIGEKPNIKTYFDFIFLTFTKMYFYIFISYFVVKKITQRLNQ